MSNAPSPVIRKSISEKLVSLNKSEIKSTAGIILAFRKISKPAAIPPPAPFNTLFEFINLLFFNILTRFSHPKSIILISVSEAPF